MKLKMISTISQNSTKDSTDKPITGKTLCRGGVGFGAEILFYELEDNYKTE